eukprot:6190858-Pleurochrysis_carterae.AAC.1
MARGEGGTTRLTGRAASAPQALGDRDDSRLTVLKAAEEGAFGGGGDGPSEFASRRASAMAARPPEGPGCTSTSPASGIKSRS